MNNLSFTKLIVGDLSAMIKFYGSVFGLSEQQRAKGEIEGSEVEEVVLGSSEPGGATLILLQYLDGRPVITGELVIGMITDDIAGVVGRAKSNKGRIVLEPMDAKMDEVTMKLAMLADPEGHLIEAVQL